nr:hypothetical protein [Duncaniella dubosii]
MKSLVCDAVEMPRQEDRFNATACREGRCSQRFEQPELLNVDAGKIAAAVEGVVTYTDYSSRMSICVIGVEAKALAPIERKRSDIMQPARPFAPSNILSGMQLSTAMVTSHSFCRGT